MSSESGIIVLAGGGTGGHVYPALALGEALARRGWSLAYLGDPRRLEGRVVPERGIPFHPVPAPQYPRRGLWSKVRFATSLLRSVVRARGVLKKLDADFVLGVGGYISAPPILAAWTLGIPRAVHEANVTPGLANRLCARVANRVFLTYPQTAERLAVRAPKEVVGCPIEPRVLRGDAEAALRRYGLSPERPLLLVVGGSLGAATINRLGVAVSRRAAARQVQVVVVTGPAYHEAVQAELDPLPPGVAVVDYERHMPDAYAAAALVLCRAGSSTLAELTAIGKPSVLVPSPNVTDNHQEGNARGLESQGAARVVLEADLADGFEAQVESILGLLEDSAALSRMSEAALALGQPGTAERVAEQVEAMLAEG